MSMMVTTYSSKDRRTSTKGSSKLGTKGKQNLGNLESIGWMWGKKQD